MNLQRKANQDSRRIAHKYESESNGQVWLDVPFRERCIHYEQSTFWGEEDSQYLEWGMIFEAVEMDMPNTLNHMNVLGIDRTEFMEYILGSNGSRRPLKLPNGHISAKTLEKLISLGLAITTADRTAMEILGSCTVTELKSIVKPFGLKLTGIKKSDLVAICLKTMPPEKILDLMERQKKI